MLLLSGGNIRRTHPTPLLSKRAFRQTPNTATERKLFLKGFFWGRTLVEAGANNAPLPYYRNKKHQLHAEKVRLLLRRKQQVHPHYSHRHHQTRILGDKYQTLTKLSFFLKKKTPLAGNLSSHLHKLRLYKAYAVVKKAALNSSRRKTIGVVEKHNMTKALTTTNYVMG
jgi:hypothetical protein